MTSAPPLTGSIAASKLHHWLRAWYAEPVPEAVDLEVVRQMLPATPFGAGVREIRPPVPFDDAAFEGMLARDPTDPAVWGIAYNGSVSPERQRFTIAHELGHFVLHRNRQPSFDCDKESVYSGHETMRQIEREADDFAANLLMPGDLLRQWTANRRIDLHVLSAIAQRFQVSFEALCIRFIKYTGERAILVYWDNGYAKYEWRSSSAVKTRARIRRTDDPQEPLPGTLAADASVVQAWEGVEMSAAIWCPEEAPYMKLREFKHSYGAKDRVLTLLLLESAEPRGWGRLTATSTPPPGGRGLAEILPLAEPPHHFRDGIQKQQRADGGKNCDVEHAEHGRDLEQRPAKPNPNPDDGEHPHAAFLSFSLTMRRTAS